MGKKEILHKPPPIWTFWLLPRAILDKTLARSLGWMFSEITMVIVAYRVDNHHQPSKSCAQLNLMTTINHQPRQRCKWARAHLKAILKQKYIKKFWSILIIYFCIIYIIYAISTFLRHAEALYRNRPRTASDPRRKTGSMPKSAQRCSGEGSAAHVRSGWCSPGKPWVSPTFIVVYIGL